MNGATKQLRLDIRVRNNRLIRAREELGLNQAEAARRIGIEPARLSALETMRDGREGQAWTEQGWTTAAQRIAAFYGLSPEYLWSKEISIVRQNAMRLEVGAREVAVLAGTELDANELSAVIHDALATLNPAERGMVVRTIVDGETLDGASSQSCGGLSRERARQIREKGLVKLRDALLQERKTLPHNRLHSRECPVCSKKFRTARAAQEICSRSCVSSVMRVPRHRARRLAEREVGLWTWLDHERVGWVENSEADHG